MLDIKDKFDLKNNIKKIVIYFNVNIFDVLIKCLIFVNMYSVVNG